MDLLQFDPATDFRLLLAVPLIPLLGFVVNVFLGRRLPRQGDFLLTGGMFVVMAITVWLFAKALWAAYHGTPFHHSSVDHGLSFGWFFSSPETAAGAANVVAGILYDPLGAAMLMVVGVVSFCVHLFSMGYMRGDRRYHVFFANISLFTFAMLGLVLADNILFLFIFWEVMGLMSYLLIGHFAHDPGSGMFHRWATWASKKAFLTTRVGDVCLLVGILIFHQHFGTFRFTELWEAARLAVEANGGEHPAWMTAAGLLVFGGTVGKSAQFPLHIWLPDAMAGPTPVSAMIHAATMVAAGVFLLGRTYPLLPPETLVWVAVIGTITALFAATIGTTAFDLKAVLAYSTISQLGFMVAAVGLGAVVAGMFHMVTHAFFKACLFLSAGSVIHGCHHEQDMRHMGGLRKQMPVTFACMLVCTLAISGVPLFAGFYSKDMILMGAFERNLEHMSGVATFASIALPLAALLTTFYMFRLVFLTFFGTYRGAHAVHAHDDHHGAEDNGHVPHESPPVMLAALVVLALLGIFGGKFWLAGDAGSWFTRLVSLESLYGVEVGHWLHQPVDGHVEHTAHSLAVGVSLTIVALGFAAAWFLYVRRRDLPARIAGALGPIYSAARDKYYVDEVVDTAVVLPTVALARGLKATDERVVDGAVLLVGRANRSAGFFSAWFDRVFVDGLVNFVGTLSQAFGSVVRLFQTGRIQQYAAFAVAGGLLTAAWLILA